MQTNGGCVQMRCCRHSNIHFCIDIYAVHSLHWWKMLNCMLFQSLFAINQKNTITHRIQIHIMCNKFQTNLCWNRKYLTGYVVEHKADMNLPKSLIKLNYGFKVDAQMVLYTTGTSPLHRCRSDMKYFHN